jgi:hypothetical protein
MRVCDTNTTNTTTTNTTSFAQLQDPEAAAFYQAQRAMLARTRGTAARPGSAKKKSGPHTTFSVTQRADITARVRGCVLIWRLLCVWVKGAKSAWLCAGIAILMCVG